MMIVFVLFFSWESESTLPSFCLVGFGCES